MYSVPLRESFLTPHFHTKWDSLCCRVRYLSKDAFEMRRLFFAKQLSTFDFCMVIMLTILKMALPERRQHT